MIPRATGPWVVLQEEPGVPYLRIRGTVLGSRYKIANVMFPEYEGAPQSWRDETHRTASLISAAPDMLAELIKAREALDGLPRSLGFDFTHLPGIDAAIAKATGASA